MRAAFDRTACAEVLEIGPGEQLPAVSHRLGLLPLSSSEWTRQAPDRHLIVVDESATLMARCSCWWTNVPHLDGQRLGAIGHFGAVDLRAARLLLANACACLVRAGCTYAVGPMDGNTWRNYRLVIDKGTEAPFFLEPWTSPGCLEQWTTAGFAPIAEYMSTLTADLSVEDPRADRARTRLARSGIVIRQLDSSEPERDLRRIFALSVKSFRANFLYADFAETEFLEQSLRLLPVVRPELVLLAEGERDELCGFLFAVPDVMQERRGLAIDTVIIKTAAVASGLSTAGLGSVLVAEVHRIARERGYRRAIHALMHTQNPSRNISRRYGSAMRRYALLGRCLRRSDLGCGLSPLGFVPLSADNVKT